MTKSLGKIDFGVTYFFQNLIKLLPHGQNVSLFVLVDAESLYSLGFFTGILKKMWYVEKVGF